MQLRSFVLGGRGRRPRWLLACLAGVLAFGITGGSASAANLGSSPLTSIDIGSTLDFQVKHSGDTQNAFYPPSTTPGDAGTMVAMGGTLFAPNFNAHTTATSSLGSYTPWSPAGQTARSGSGSSSDPFKTVTNVTGGGLALSETDTYVTGQESFRTDVSITNNTGSPQTLIVYRGGDCYLEGSDEGFGFTAPNGAVGCSANPNNSPKGRILQFASLSGPTNFLEDGFDEVWQAIGSRQPLSNQCAKCTVKIDNGMAISWQVTLQPGQTVTLSALTTFSPTGNTGGGPPSNSADLLAAKTPKCGQFDRKVRNRTGKVPGGGSVLLKTTQRDNPTFPVRLAVSSKGVGIKSVVFLANGKLASVNPSAKTTNVLVSLLKTGSRSKNRIVAVVVLTNGKTVTLTQFMVILKCRVPPVTCKRQAGGKRLLCKSRTPTAGRRARVTVTKSGSETAKGSANVVRGRYTVIASSRVALAPGTYAYKAVVTTNRRGVRFLMIRLVTVT